MPTKFFVFRCYRYRESGNWEYNLVGCYDTLTAAKQAYHDALGRIIKASNDHAMCIMFDSWGNKIECDVDNTVEETGEE